ITEVVATVSETVSAAAVVQADVPAAPVNAAAVMTTAAQSKLLSLLPEEEEELPQTEAQARRNMMMYMKNTAGFTLDFFKGMSYDDIQATPLARKVPVVDYHIIHVDNKPRYKIIRADDTHQLYRSFITMLKNFDRDDLGTLWNIVKDRYPLSKFTLEQMINVVRLQVEEQSEMSLELNLSNDSFGVDAAMELKEKHQVLTAASEDISVARHKLMLLDNAAD
nr:hypothetical protein [Tanacetum cinerariifolium]